MKNILFIDDEVGFLTASEMYYNEVREVKHCALNKDLFFQKPISNEDLLREIDKKINGYGIRPITELTEKEFLF